LLGFCIICELKTSVVSFLGQMESKPTLGNLAKGKRKGEDPSLELYHHKTKPTFKETNNLGVVFFPSLVSSNKILIELGQTLEVIPS
jgi:hypothetical protein